MSLLTSSAHVLDATCGPLLSYKKMLLLLLLLLCRRSHL
jgi:hypothetical protein